MPASHWASSVLNCASDSAGWVFNRRKPDSSAFSSIVSRISRGKTRNLHSYLVHKRDVILKHHLVFSAHLTGAVAFNLVSHCYYSSACLILLLSCCVPCQSSKDSLLACSQHLPPSSATVQGGWLQEASVSSAACVGGRRRTRETAVTVSESIHSGC